MRVMKTMGWFAAVLLLVVSTGCSQGEPEGAWKMINDGALLVDVRSPGEFKDGHLSGAKLIPVGEVASRIAEFGDDKDRQIVVYCKRGARAAKAESVLRENGFTNVFNGGGYSDLVASKP